jgi:quinolinate synthase
MILFGPDTNLSYYVQKRTSKQLITVPQRGNCPTHHQISLEDILLSKEENPEAVVVAHPECIPEVQDKADIVASTEGMTRYIKDSVKEKFIIATEIGLLHRLRKENPEKIFVPASGYTVCPNMKMHTLDKMVLALKSEEPEILVPRNIIERARMPVEKMLAITAKLRNR